MQVYKFDNHIQQANYQSHHYRENEHPKYLQHSQFRTIWLNKEYQLKSLLLELFGMKALYHIVQK